jgi:hypothetical protein
MPINNLKAIIKVYNTSKILILAWNMVAFLIDITVYSRENFKEEKISTLTD